MAAFLYCLTDITDKKKDGLDSVTAEKCPWNKPRKRKLSPKKAEQTERGGAHAPAGPPQASSVNFDRLAERMKAVAPKAGWLVNFTAKDQPAAAPALPETRNKPLLSFPDGWIYLLSL